MGAGIKLDTEVVKEDIIIMGVILKREGEIYRRRGNVKA